MKNHFKKEEKYYGFSEQPIYANHIVPNMLITAEEHSLLSSNTADAVTPPKLVPVALAYCDEPYGEAEQK